MKKNIICESVIVLLILLLALTGCSSKTEEQNNSNETILEEAQSQEVSAEEEKENILENIEKIDNNKEIVYSVDEYATDYYANVTNETYHYTYKYPAININSLDVQTINDEIKQKYGFLDDEKELLPFMEIECITYDYYINENILSLIPLKGGNDSTWSVAYNIDLKTLNKINNENLLQDKNIDLDAVKTKFKEFGAKRMQEELLKITNGNTTANWMDEKTAEFKEDLNKKLENGFDNIYLNENGDVCIRIDFETLGGQETCSKMMEINASKMSDVIDISYENYLK